MKSKQLVLVVVLCWFSSFTFGKETVVEDEKWEINLLLMKSASQNLNETKFSLYNIGYLIGQGGNKPEQVAVLKEMKTCHRILEEAIHKIAEIKNIQIANNGGFDPESMKPIGLSKKVKTNSIDVKSIQVLIDNSVQSLNALADKLMKMEQRITIKKIDSVKLTLDDPTLASVLLKMTMVQSSLSTYEREVFYQYLVE